MKSIIDNISKSYSLRNILLFIFVILAIIFTPDGELDLTRYYEEARSMNVNEPPMEIIERYMLSSFDFIYFLVHYIFKSIGLPVQLVTALFVYLFYKSSSDLLFLYAKKLNNISYKDINNAIVFLFFGLLYTFIFSIARMTASFAFIFIGVKYILEKKYIRGALLLLIALFTHAGSAIYILSFLTSLCISWLVTRYAFFTIKKPIIFTMITSILFVFFIEIFVKYILLLPFFGQYSYFARYIEEFSIATFSGLGSISTITLITYLIFIFICSCYQRKDPPYDFCLYLVPFTILSIFMSDMFLQRMAMFMVPFGGIMMLNSAPKCRRMQTIFTILFVFLQCSVFVATRRFFI